MPGQSARRQLDDLLVAGGWLAEGFKPFALILVAILALAGCDRQPSPNGDTQATLSYWKRLNEERPDFSDLQAASAAWAKAPGDEQVQMFRADGVIAAKMQAYRVRNQALAQMPMEGVDPALLEYTAKLATLNSSRIELMAQGRAMIGQVNQITSPDQLLLDLFGSFLRHSSDENVLTSVLRDQFQEKAQVVGNALPQFKTIQAQSQAISAAESQVEAAEIALRARLHAHHRGTFPPSSSFQRPALKPTEVERILTRRRVALDLLGQRFDGWTFEGIEELQSLEIKKRTGTGAVVTLALDCDVMGLRSGMRRKLQPVMVYQLEGESWVLRRIVSKFPEEVAR